MTNKNGGKSLYKGPFKYDVSTLCGEGGVSHTLAFLNIYDEGGMGQERANKTLFGGTPDKKKDDILFNEKFFTLRMQECKYAEMHVSKYASIQYTSMLVCKYASMHVFKYASMQIYNYASMQVCRYKSIKFINIQFSKYAST